MARYFSGMMLGLVLFACGGAAQEVEVVELGDCCKESLELVSQMSDCCQKGTSVPGELSGCCETGMLAETPDEDRPECCSKGRKLLEEMSACCRNVILANEVGGCCEAMPAELKKNAG